MTSRTAMAKKPETEIELEEEGEFVAQHPLPKPDRHIVLVGLMGVGKSSIGKRLGKVLRMQFIDSDDEIEQAAARNINDIFDVYGETLFRDLEMRVLKRLLSAEKPTVIATGGGAFAQEAVRAAVKTAGAFSIWLRADVETICERIGQKHNRPLLKRGDKRKILGRLLDEREPFYAQADLAIDSGAGEHGIVVQKILSALAEHFPTEGQ